MSLEGEDWPAPAKLNLFLHVTGRRPDGYHLLQTVFQFIDLADTLAFDVTDDGAIVRVSDLAGVPADADLVVRAARALQATTGCRSGARIRIEKRIPLGGGLGGGSSDAATTLVALNALWGTGLSDDALAELGLELGADVPVFVRGCAAFAEGVGERLQPVPLDEPWFVVVHPGCAVSTAAVFNAPELTRSTPAITIRDFLAGRQVTNDCAPVVRSRYPEVAAAMDWLQAYGAPRLTGTGACLFLAVSSEAAARDTVGRLPCAWQGYAVRGLNRSPLRSRLAALRATHS